MFNDRLDFVLIDHIIYNLHTKYMKHSSIKLSLSILSIAFVLVSCKKELTPLQKAQAVFKNSNYLSYQTVAYYPMPNSTMSNKVITNTEYLLDSLDPVGFQYSWKSQGLDKVYKGGELSLVSHKINTIRILQEKNFNSKDQFQNVVKNSFVRRKWTPIELIEHQDWKYVRDSIFDNVHLTNYSRIAGTGLNGEVKIITEQHIFVDDDGFINRLERRVLNDGEVKQSVIFNFLDYKSDKKEIMYQVPSDYAIEYGKPLPNTTEK